MKKLMSMGLLLALGLPMTANAKDSDGDGVKDKHDECRGGVIDGVQLLANGCPSDMDGDGLHDGKDDCPMTPGDWRFNGCADTDGDGIRDMDDACPNEAFDAEQGQADADEDGCIDAPPPPPITCDARQWDWWYVRTEEVGKGSKKEARGILMSWKEQGLVTVWSELAAPGQVGVVEARCFDSAEAETPTSTSLFSITVPAVGERVGPEALTPVEPVAEPPAEEPPSEE